MERRGFNSDFEVRKEGDTATIEGYAAVFDSDSELLGFFYEQVARGAFKKTIQEADVRALKNHDPNFVIARNRSGTLRLKEDDRGLHYEAKGNLRKESVRDLVEDIEDGNITQSSFGFSTIRDEWDYEADPLRRKLLEVRLFDVSPVTFPAYLDTEVDVKRALRSLASTSGRAIEVLEEAVKAGDLRSILTKESVNETTPPPADNPAPETPETPNLEDRTVEPPQGTPRRDLRMKEWLAFKELTGTPR